MPAFCSLGPNTTVVPVQMFGESDAPLQQIPPGAVISPNNYSMDRKNVIAKKVQIRTKNNPQIMKERMCLSEHPFGTVSGKNVFRENFSNHIDNHHFLYIPRKQPQIPGIYLLL